MRLEAGRRRDGGKRRLSDLAGDGDALIAEVARRPDDVELVRVFADWLLQQGHPAGELAVVQLERRTRDGEALAAREDELVRHHVRPYLEAVLARDHVTELEWRGGLLHRATFHHHGGEELLEQALRRLASDPCGRLVRRIEISAVEFDGAGDLEPALAELGALAPRFPRLAELAISEGMNLGNPWIDGPIRVGELAPIYAGYPDLEILELAGKEYGLGALALPALRRLAIADASPADVACVAAAPLPALAELELHFGRWRVDGLDAVFRELLDRTLPAIVRVAIAAEAAAVMQYLVRALPGSALAKHARVLAFPRVTLDDDCVRTLVQWAPRLRALDRLEVDGSRLAPDHVRALRAALGPRLVLR